MNIIIEGVDRSGKSTLSKWLINKFNLNYYHFTIPKSVHSKNDIILDPTKLPFCQFLTYTNQFVNESNNLLIDRFVYSNYVYGPIYKTFANHVTLDEIHCIEKMLMPCPTCIIHCELSDFERNWQLIEEEGESLITRSTLQFFRNRYDNLLKQTTLPIFKYDYTKKDSLKQLEKFINEVKLKTITKN
jgi:thymidylate kinase